MFQTSRPLSQVRDWINNKLPRNIKSRLLSAEHLQGRDKNFDFLSNMASKPLRNLGAAILSSQRPKKCNQCPQKENGALDMILACPRWINARKSISLMVMHTSESSCFLRDKFSLWIQHTSKQLFEQTKTLPDPLRYSTLVSFAFYISQGA